MHHFEIRLYHLAGEPIPTIKEYALGFDVNPHICICIGQSIILEPDEIWLVSFDEALGLLKFYYNKDRFVMLDGILDREPMQ